MICGTSALLNFVAHDDRDGRLRVDGAVAGIGVKRGDGPGKVVVSVHHPGCEDAVCADRCMRIVADGSGNCDSHDRCLWHCVWSFYPLAFSFRNRIRSSRSCALGTWKSMLLPGTSVSGLVSHCSSVVSFQTMCAFTRAGE